MRKHNNCLRRCTCCDIKRMAASKQVIVYGYNSFLLELFEHRHLENSVSRLLDNNSNIWGETKVICGKSFKIESPETIKNCNVRNTALVIIAPYYELLYRQLHEINPELEIYYYRTKEDRIALRYYFLFKRNKTKNIILFRSGKNNLPLFDVDDNAKVMYDYMIKHNFQNTYKMVWVVKETGDFKWLKSKHTDVVSYKWENTENPLKAIKYAYYTHYAKYCFFTDDCYWMRNHSENQILISLWHGCGFKARSQKSEPTGSHYHYMTVNSKFYAELHQKLYGCKKEQMLITGLPKQDLLFSKGNFSFFEGYGVNRDSKIILWLPTFRKNVQDCLTDATLASETGLAVFDVQEKLKKLNNWLADKNIFLFVKPHPAQSLEEIHIPLMRNICLVKPEELKKKRIHINSLLVNADALLSDYSSAAVDYMLLDRPIGFVIPDLEEYRMSRGFAFDPVQRYLPGMEIYTESDFYNFLQDIVDGKDMWAEKRRRLIPVMHRYADGKNCKRILKKLGLERREAGD